MATAGVFAVPENLDTALWRYLSLPRFIAMLQTKALYFAPAWTLDDRFEGSYPLPDRSEERVRRLVADANSPLSRLTPDDLKAFLDLLGKDLRSSVLLSCWHASEAESVAMWKLYAADSVCIRSTFRRLATVLKAPLESNDDCPPAQCRVGLVRYIDYNTHTLGTFNALAPFLHKRLAFAHEREVRAVYYEGASRPRSGRLIEVPLPDLVESIILAPGTPPWLQKVVQDLLTTYQLAVPLLPSALDQEPVY